ncbi:hypothetical protein DYB32_007380 [Aphanomyces invadans]|uniref:Uncharacterized protein n=1 Tax=Aphanomyces invadans TaxID=157072 RepID=A0A418ANZ4_9STRA|nr:hypothetical protein DYB32_007380 [Aphanomyces invadans]
MVQAAVGSLEDEVANNVAASDDITIADADLPTVVGSSSQVWAKDKAPPFSTKQYAMSLGGFLYLFVSLACGVWYCTTLRPSLANDLWWSGYNLTGYEAFIVDLTNSMLSSSQSGPFDLQAPGSVVEKKYTSSVSTTTVYPTYVHHLIWNELTQMEYAIANLRNLSASWSMRVNTQHCWVDFDKNFEMAHTVERQARCNTRYVTNAAVYMEAILRNVVWKEYMAKWGGPNSQFDVAVQQALDEREAGRRWLDSTSKARDMTSQANELEYWKSYHLTEFKLQFQNRWQAGITETIVVKNALGMAQKVTVKDVSRGAGPWTTVEFFWIPLNDLWMFKGYNRSVIRGSSNYYLLNISSDRPPIDVSVDMAVADPDGTYPGAQGLVRFGLGQFFAIDMFILAQPAALLTYYHAFQTFLYKQLKADPDTFVKYNALAKLIVDPVPPTWSSAGYRFHGGNPLCRTGDPKPFVQQSWDMDDGCSAQNRLVVPLAKNALLFALASQDYTTLPTASVCALQSSAECAAAIDAAKAVLAKLGTFPDEFDQLRTAAAASVAALNVGLMQFASMTNGTWKHLTQPMLSEPAWNVYGWMFLFDWVEGKREVLSFEGDVSTWVLMSNAYAGVPYSTSGRGLEQATQIVFYLVAATSALVCWVAFLCTLYGILIRFQVHGQNLLQFNRVAGSVWIGRPLTFLRGFTAVIVLSTSQLNLVLVNGYSKFDFAPRHWLATLIITGEATWLTYAANDILLLMAQDTTALYAPVSSCFVWLIYFILELSSPVMPSATINRECHAQDVDYNIFCNSGELEIGSLRRVGVLLIIQAVVIAATFVGGWLCKWSCKKWVRSPGQRNLLVSGPANCFIQSYTDASSGMWTVDKVSGVLCGLVPFSFRGKNYTFDLKLWIVLQDPDGPTGRFKALPNPVLSFDKAQSRHSILATTALATKDGPSDTTRELTWKDRARLYATRVAGICTVAGSVAGSVSYLEVSKVNLANDACWAYFNLTGGHGFIGNWLNEQLLLGLNHEDVLFDSTYINQLGSFDKPSAYIASSMNYGSYMQYSEVNTIEHNVPGLRRTDACKAPWIFTQYCYVDFDKTWEMANSAARQARCQASMAANGAVYLDSILRNVDWDAWTSCWGDAFETAFAVELRKTLAGIAYLQSIATTRLSVEDEIAYWKAKGITSYTVQWQNYKRVGLINKYTLQNAYGGKYPLTLQAQNGTLRMAKQTMFKMYWSFANDLAAITRPNSGMTGKSLIRSSVDFAFATTTMEQVLMANELLKPTLSVGFNLTKQIIGPFGSVDLMYVPVPASAKVAVRAILSGLRTVIAPASSAADASTVAAINATQTAYAAIKPVDMLSPIPPQWLAAYATSNGGNPLCEEMSVANAMSSNMAPLLSFDNECSNTAVAVKTFPTRESMITAVILAGLPTMPTYNATDICSNDPGHIKQCPEFIDKNVAFVKQFMPQAPSWAPLVASAKADMVALDIQLFQYARQTSTAPLHVLHVNILDPIMPTFEPFAWSFLYEWFVGHRTVVQLHGDVGSLTVLSDLEPPLYQQVQPWELPANYATYARGGVLYVTFIMIAVAVFVLVYIVVSRGHFEGLNMMELARVGGIVWVGRPLLLLRSATAIALLSTGTLELQFDGMFSSFQSVQMPWYKTLLGAMELTWLVSIVNDVSMVVTQEYTTYYVMVNSLVVWIVASAVTAAHPVTHTASFDRVCQVDDVDFQVVCSSGQFMIGQWQRALLLVGIVLVSNFSTYWLVRLVMRTKPVCDANSLFLSSGAKYLFSHDARVHNQVYYLDRASAIMCGIVTLRWRRTIFAMDLKIWRIFAIELPHAFDIPPNTPLAAAASHAFPLTD